MTRIIYTLVRYILTAVGASEAVASDDVVMQIASGIVAAASVVWGLYESRHHAKLAAATGQPDSTAPTGGAASLLVACALLLPVLAAGTGCSTTVASSADGSVTTTSTVDWTSVDFVAQKSVQYAVKAVLDNNPKYAGSLAAVGAGLSGIVVGTPTEASLESSIRAFAPNLDDVSVTAIAGVLKDACDLYTAKTGSAAIVPADENVKNLVGAIAKGIADGIALHDAAVAAKAGQSK
jgi:hypothetical protein